MRQRMIAVLIIGSFTMPAFASETGPAAPVRKAVCAVCGVREKAGPEPVAATWKYRGKTYDFCSDGCKAEFQKEPDHWIKLAAAMAHEHGHAKSQKGSQVPP